MSAPRAGGGANAPAGRTATDLPPPEALRRVAIVTDRYPPLLGGAERDTHLIARGLAERGIGVTVLTRRHGARGAGREEIDGVEVRRLGRSRGFRPRPLDLLLFARSAERHLREHAGVYDAVLAVPLTFHSDLLPVHRAHRRTGTPYVVRTVSSGDFRFLLGPTDGSLRARLRRAFVPSRSWRRILATAAGVTVQSEAVARVAAGYGVEDVTVAPNGVDCDRFRPATARARTRLRRRLGLPPDGFIVVNAARLAEGKNQETLLRALARAREPGGEEAGPVPRVARRGGPHGGASPAGPMHLLLLGAREPRGRGSNEAAVRALIQGHGLGSAVTLRVDVDDVEDHLRASDLFVFPSLLDEGMPNAVLEAMACGLPCVCVDRAPVRAVATPGTGVFVSGEDDREMARAITALRRDAVARRRLGRAARSRVERCFRAGPAVRRYERLLAGAGAGGRAAAPVPGGR